MLDSASPVRFIQAVPFTARFAKKQVDSERKDIDQMSNTIVYGGDSIRGVIKLRSCNGKHKLYTHIYYHAMKTMKVREELFSYVTMLKEQAEKNSAEAKQKEDYTKYLLIRNSDKSTSGYTITIKDDVIAKELETAGWMLLVSNDISSATEAIAIYREKDVVEKGFFV
ncbi:hypothetical protein [Sporomusa ovata]|uniref:Uncharacterized protein n=2 Tax=Sporomusa ovata TaxID=2378 RepID=A0A0U1KSZ3_9FIRM|nr:hypothetical protein [Sporomusa ovata]CQR70542.1 hypothetical protein SpAn4DRAFT_1511 [Sporomusa ovata]